MTIQLRRMARGARGAGKRSLMLIVAIVVVSVALWLLAKQWKSQTFVLHVHLLPQQQYLIHTDTTNYEQFASSLLLAIQRHRVADAKPPITIALHIPAGVTILEINDIVQIVQATNVQFELKKEE